MKHGGVALPVQGHRDEDSAGHTTSTSAWPQWGDDDIEARLRALLAHYAPATLIIAGDVVHAAPGAPRARTLLETLTHTMRVVLGGGNHDRRSPLTCVDSLHEGDFFIHHGDVPRAVPTGALEIVGHHHPAATWWDGAGTSLRLPALVEGPQRLILPAFSPWAGGVPWNNQLRANERLWFISSRRIFPLRVGSVA